MRQQLSKNIALPKVWLCLLVVSLAGCATLYKSSSDARIEELRTFHIAFIDQFAVKGKAFDAAAFDAKVKEGNAKFQDAIANEKFKARIKPEKDLAEQFKADAAHLRSKASRGKITPKLAEEMKRDVNDNYDQVLGKKHS